MPITIKNINKFYGKEQALNNVSFSLKKGDVVGFLGPNGAGKSTLIRIITCYLKQTSGTIQVDGLDTLKDDIKVKSIIGYLAENNPLYTSMYVKEYLEFVARIYKLKQINNKITNVINSTRLESQQHKKIYELSKGYKQRVGLAASLIHDPKILILDEPMTGLDPNQLIEIRELIREVGKNKTVLFSTHIMQEVEKICNRIIIINKGNIVDDKYVRDVTNNNIEEHFRKITKK